MSIFEYFRAIVRGLWLVPFLLIAEPTLAQEICSTDNVLLPGYPVALNLRKILCESGSTQNGYLDYSTAKTSPELEIQWVAMTWQRNYKNEAKVSIQRIIADAVNECDGAARENITRMTLFRKNLYKRAILFGRFPKSKKMEDFSNEDAKAEAIAGTKAACNVDLSLEKIIWQVLD